MCLSIKGVNNQQILRTCLSNTSLMTCIIWDGPSGVGHTVGGLVDNMLVALSDFAADKQVLPRD